MHVIRTWCQPSDKRSVYTSMRCRHAWKQHMRTDTLKHEMSPYLQPQHADRHVGTVCCRACDPDMLMNIWSSRQDKRCHFACVLAMLRDMWSTRCRRACVRSHAERHTDCHQPEGDWLLTSINRHAQLHISTHPDHFRSV